jgi:uncharacterized membrane protein YuzA (DUF378 family)
VTYAEFWDLCRFRGRDNMLDGFYILIGLAGFAVLWAITKGCERL